ncbi:MAG TPA: DUF981 family protein [Thermoplasmata archaeon]|nr:DUF981 family protein [Thermoplasmata archaeon]
MVFIDNLALVEVLLLLGAAVLAYGGVLCWWAIRTNNPKALRSVLKGMGVPVGGVGLVATILALEGEMAWPFPATMAGYNIFFFDVLLLFGIVLLAYALSAYFGARMQYVGLLALVAGGVTAFYGWTGYTANPAFTKEPFDTLLLYLGFGAAGVFAYPATVIMDYYLGTVDSLQTPFASSAWGGDSYRRKLGVRATQPIVPAVASSTPASPSTEKSELAYHVPIWVQAVLLLFPVFMALAGIAALWYFGTTLPGHLGAGAAKAP